jgi:hypothetical protein
MIVYPDLGYAKEVINRGIQNTRESIPSQRSIRLTHVRILGVHVRT